MLPEPPSESASKWRSHAAQPRAAGGGRAIRNIGSDVPGPHRPWAWPCARRRWTHYACVAPGFAPDGRRFPELLEELRTYLGPVRPGQVVRAYPGQGSQVPITLLGSSIFSAQLAASLGMPFAFAAHFAPDDLLMAAQVYTSRFQPSEELSEPYLMVAIQVIGAETDEEAKRLFTTPQQRFLRLLRNRPVELLPPVDSMEGLWTPGERMAVQSRLGAAIVGSSPTVQDGIERLVRQTGASELIVVTDTYDAADRHESYRRVAEIAAVLGEPGKGLNASPAVSAVERISELS